MLHECFRNAHALETGWNNNLSHALFARLHPVLSVNDRTAQGHLSHETVGGETEIQKMTRGTANGVVRVETARAILE